MMFLKMRFDTVESRAHGRLEVLEARQAGTVASMHAPRATRTHQSHAVKKVGFACSVELQTI